MPTYDYRCGANGRIVEVKHRLSETLFTWAELCAAANIAPGDTPPDSPVERLITGGAIVGSAPRRQAEPPPCEGGAGPGCGACVLP